MCKLQRTRSVFLACSLLLAAIAGAQPPGESVFHNGHEAAGQEVLVKFRAVNGQTLLQIMRDEDIDQAVALGSEGMLYRLHSRSKSIDTLVRDISSWPEIQYAEANHILRVNAIPNDPDFSQQWSLRNTAGADIGAAGAWDVATGSTANVAAVIDTGVDYNHPDLAPNMWSAPTAFTVMLAGSAVTCPAGSHGLNVITRSCDPMDDSNHGTHVAGTIGAVGNNGGGVAGINWTARIMALKFMNSGGVGDVANAVLAIEFAIQAKQQFGSLANVRVLSNSWGGTGFSQSLLDEVNKANAADMLVVAAAGNSITNLDATPFYPASFNAPNVIAVAATDGNDALADFSDYGANSVHLGAPGVNILSTVIGGGYQSWSGTSMATPHVAGSALLVLSACSLGTSALKNNLLGNVDSVSSLAGKTITGGRLNVNKAIHACAGASPPSLTGISVNPSSVIGGQTSAGTVSLSSAAGAGGAVVSLSSSSPGTASVPAVVTIPQGSAATGFTVNTSGVSGTTAVAVTASYLGASTTTTLTVTAPPPPVVVSISPGSVNLSGGQTQNFTATVTGTSNQAVTWSLSSPVGSLSGGLYTAPARVSSSQTVNVIATSVVDPSKSASATVSLTAGGTPSITIDPSGMTLNPAQTQQYAAAVTGTAPGVTWSIYPAGKGSITATGLYTAPSNVSSFDLVNITAQSTSMPTVQITTVAFLRPGGAGVSVSVTPGAATLSAGQGQQFTATVTGSSNTAVTWTLNPNVGNITPAGMYIAPSTVSAPQVVTVTATSVADGTKVAGATVSLRSTAAISVSVSPSAISLTNGQSQRFTATVTGSADTRVIWLLNLTSLTPGPSGDLTPDGVYYASQTISSPQVVDVMALSMADPTKFAIVTVTLTPAGPAPVKSNGSFISVAITPPVVSLSSYQLQQFAAAVSGTSQTAVKWSMTPALGTLYPNGLYFAPQAGSAPQTVRITATSVADPTVSATAIVTLKPLVTVSISPTAVWMSASQSQQFTSSVTGAGPGVAWSIYPQRGKISASGLYTAPPSVQSLEAITISAGSLDEPNSRTSTVVYLKP